MSLSFFQAQPNYVELEPNSRVSMYSNWKVKSEDCHPSRLSPKQGMSCYNSAYHDSTRVGLLYHVPEKFLSTGFGFFFIIMKYLDTFFTYTVFGC